MTLNKKNGGVSLSASDNMMRSMFLVMFFLAVNASARYVGFDPTAAGYGKS